MTVEMFITTKFNGRVSKGNGVYGVVRRLEGRPDTAKCGVIARKEVSYQELNAHAVVDAI